MSILALAKAAGYNQSTFYRHIEKEDLPYHIIKRYGRAMEYDLRTVFPEMDDSDVIVRDKPQAPYGLKKQSQEVQDEVNFWKEKYYTLLELHNKLLREKLESAGL
ncbi:TetR/AcrR family transcriptional regulator [Mongoliitalea lutea]|nr:TetR/AcrR family transcriptional regulator [Mongoliitalea lutea]